MFPLAGHATLGGAGRATERRPDRLTSDGPKHMASNTAESIYVTLIDEEDARVCTDISDAACRETPGNFILLLASYFFTKLGDAAASPKIVLPWLLSTVQAPVYLIGLLVPIRESGSMIPQLVIASAVRRMPVRKWAWVTGSCLQALAILAIGVVAMVFSGALAGWLIVTALVAFSLARGLCSVASKDVLGKTIPKGKRGQLTGLSASAAGLITIGLGIALVTVDLAQASAVFYGSLIAAAGGTWVIAAGSYALVKEFPGETSGGGNALTEAFKRMRILVRDAGFRRFVVVRALLIGTALSAPYYIALAQKQLGSPAYLLGLFLASSGLASLVSGPVWGRHADRSSRVVMVRAALIAATIGILVFGAAQWSTLTSTVWFLPVCYFLLSIAHDGVRVGRKTYIVDLAGGNRRTDYVAVSNTVIGIVLLLAGIIGTLSSVVSIAGMILILSAVAGAGAVVGMALPEAEK